jgi:hypothetical protein
VRSGLAKTLDTILLKNRSKKGAKVTNVTLSSAGGSAVLPASKAVDAGRTVKLVPLSGAAIVANMVHVAVAAMTKAGAQVSATFIVPLDVMDKGKHFDVHPATQDGDVASLGLLGAKVSRGTLTLTIT